MKFRGPWRRIEDRLTRSEPLEPGLYHYQIGDRYGGTRFHLRIDPDGRGILSVNAQKVIHLNPTAAEYAKLVLDGEDEEVAVRRLKSRYKVPAGEVRSDYEDLRKKIELLGAPSSDVCPVTFLDMERIEPFMTPAVAPYRLDFALTYACDNECRHCYVERPRDFPEMDTDRWKEALVRAWDLGIPHVVFTGGEATTRPDLVELVEYAEDLGLITGLLTNGRNLGKGDLMDRLAEAGLDHVQVTIESHLEDIHDAMVGCPGSWQETIAGLKKAIASPVYTITNSTITALNRDTLLETVDFLYELGLDTIAMNGVIYTGRAREGESGVPEDEMEALVDAVHQRAHSRGMRFIWYTPTRYCALDPVALGLGPKQCTAAKYNMCVEPNGDVIPCQSYYEPLGNLLSDDWDSIWNHPVSVSIREREFAEEKCADCDKFNLCGAGCPLFHKKDATICVDSKSSG